MSAICQRDVKALTLSSTGPPNTALKWSQVATFLEHDMQLTGTAVTTEEHVESTATQVQPSKNLMAETESLTCMDWRL